MKLLWWLYVFQQLALSSVIKTVSMFYLHLQGLNIANSNSKTSFDVDLLVGLDFYYNFITGKVKRGQIGEPIAIESKLGWNFIWIFKIKFSSDMPE